MCEAAGSTETGLCSEALSSHMPICNLGRISPTGWCREGRAGPFIPPSLSYFLVKWDQRRLWRR